MNLDKLVNDAINNATKVKEGQIEQLIIAAKNFLKTIFKLMKKITVEQNDENIVDTIAKQLSSSNFSIRQKDYGSKVKDEHIATQVLLAQSIFQKQLNNYFGRQSELVFVFPEGEIFKISVTNELQILKKTNSIGGSRASLSSNKKLIQQVGTQIFNNERYMKNFQEVKKRSVFINNHLTNLIESYKDTKKWSRAEEHMNSKGQPIEAVINSKFHYVGIKRAQQIENDLLNHFYYYDKISKNIGLPGHGQGGYLAEGYVRLITAFRGFESIIENTQRFLQELDVGRHGIIINNKNASLGADIVNTGQKTGEGYDIQYAVKFFGTASTPMLGPFLRTAYILAASDVKQASKKDIQEQVKIAQENLQPVTLQAAKQSVLTQLKNNGSLIL